MRRTVAWPGGSRQSPVTRCQMPVPKSRNQVASCQHAAPSTQFLEAGIRSTRMGEWAARPFLAIQPRRRQGVSAFAERGMSGEPGGQTSARRCGGGGNTATGTLPTPARRFDGGEGRKPANRVLPQRRRDRGEAPLIRRDAGGKVYNDGATDTTWGMNRSGRCGRCVVVVQDRIPCGELLLVRTQYRRAAGTPVSRTLPRRGRFRSRRPS